MAYEKRRFTDEQIQTANDVNILEYARQYFDVKRVGVNSYKIEGYGGLHINPVTNKWNCFSQDKGGGVIQFVMFIENKSWVESVKQLLGLTINNAITYQKDIREKEKDIKGELILPEKNNTYKHAIAYLIKTRKIDKGIVYDLIKNKKLYEDKNRNCVFVGYDKEGNAKYASIRGTNTNRVYKGDIKNSDKSYSFCIEGLSNKIYVFEAPIEVMSYLTLIKDFNYNATHDFNNHMISLGCLGDVALDRYLDENPNINEITLCFNNDKWGRLATERIKEKYINRYKVNINFPYRKDYNEDLQELSETIGDSEIKQPEESEYDEYNAEL